MGSFLNLHFSFFPLHDLSILFMKLPLLFSFSHSFFSVSTHKSKVFFLKFSFFFFKKGLLYLNLQCLFIFYFFSSFFPLFLFFFYSFFILNDFLILTFYKYKNAC